MISDMISNFVIYPNTVCLGGIRRQVLLKVCLSYFCHRCTVYGLLLANARLWLGDNVSWVYVDTTYCFMGLCRCYIMFHWVLGLQHTVSRVSVATTYCFMGLCGYYEQGTFYLNINLFRHIGFQVNMVDYLSSCSS